MSKEKRKEFPILFSTVECEKEEHPVLYKELEMIYTYLSNEAEEL